MLGFMFTGDATIQIFASGTLSGTAYSSCRKEGQGHF